MNVPNSSEKEIIHKGGLGVRKIKFNLQNNEDEVFRKFTVQVLEEVMMKKMPQ